MAIWNWVIEIVSSVLGAYRWLAAKVKPRRTRGRLQYYSPVKQPMLVYSDLGFYKHEGVKWLLQYPFSVRISSDADAASELRVSGPYCPECETKLLESEILWRFWGKYQWLCDNCGFEKRSKKSAFEVEGAAHRVFEAMLRKEFEKGHRGMPSQPQPH